MTTYRKIHGRAIKSVSSNLSAPSAEGQIWFNTTDNKFKSVVSLEAFSSGANTINSKQRVGGCGTQNAGLACGGLSAPPDPPGLATTEEYDGTGWTAGGTLNTARGNTALIGTQTAAVFSGKGSPGTPYAGTTELYNGTAWTTNPNSAPDTYNYRSSCGTQTAGLLSGGNYPPTNRAAGNEHFDGTSFSEGGDLPQKQSQQGQAGTQTAAINSFGNTNSPVPGNSGDADNAISLEYDGTSWTAGPNGRGVVDLSGYDMGAGTQTDALFVGGPPTNSCKYDGTTFTVGPALATAQPASAHGSASASATWVAHGSPIPSVGNKTQEFNSSATVVTAAAWSSSGNVPVSIRGGGSGGTKDGAWMSGGLKNSPTLDRNDTYLYDGSSWTAGNDLPNNYFVGGGTGPQTAGLLWDGIVSGGGPGTTTYEFDGTNWTAASTYPAIGPNGSQGSTGAGVGQTAAVSMGGTGDPPPAQSARMIAYDGSSWTADTSMPTGVSGCAADGPNSAIWIAGGYSSPDSTSTASKEYDGSSWTTTGNLAFALAPSGQRFQGWGPQTSAIIAGGTGSPSTNHSCQQYNGTIWATAVSLGTGRDGNSFCSKTAGTKEGFIAAGYGDSANTNATEEFTEETTSLNVKDLTQS